MSQIITLFLSSVMYYHQSIMASELNECGQQDPAEEFQIKSLNVTFV